MSFWTDTKVADDFTPEDRYFYLYLFTNPHTNLAGCYEISTRQMANETGYSKDTIERLINRFETIHKVIGYDNTTKEMLLVNWHKYNWTKSADFRKSLLKDIESVKNADFRDFLKDLYDGVKTVPRPSLDGVGTTVTDTVTDSNTVSDKKDKYNTMVTNIIKERNYSDYIYNNILKWLAYKKERKQSYTETGLKTLLNKIDKSLLNCSEQQFGDLIDECMARNYQGIIFDMLDKKKTGSGSAYIDAIKNRVSDVDNW
jgi:DNA-binding transcriptional regulator YhcF (GntR family)